MKNNSNFAIIAANERIMIRLKLKYCIPYTIGVSIKRTPQRNVSCFLIISAIDGECL